MHFLFNKFYFSDDPYYPVQLVSNKDNEGCVQFFHNHTWGSFCHADPGSLTTVSEVICRTLGFPSANTASQCSGYPSSPDYSLPVWLSNVSSCTGHESSILECSLGHYGVHACKGHTHDVTVSCKLPGLYIAI